MKFKHLGDYVLHRLRKPQKYAQEKVKAAHRRREQTFSGQNIGPPGPPKEPARRAEGFKSFRRFCELYFPSRFDLAWSPDHLHVLARIEDAILHGGLFALAMPRGQGKTTICQVACMWAVMTGRHDFVMLIAVSATRAQKLLDGIKTELRVNPLLHEDFGNITHAVRELQNRANKAKGQHIDGMQTEIIWNQSEIVLPTVTGSEASGCILRVGGLTGGAIRGAMHTRTDGRTVRPSLSLIDDPQDNRSAKSNKQVADRLELINGAVLGMAGPGKPFAAICPVTVIRKDDLADSLLSRAKSPLWTGQRFALLPRFPDEEAMKLWDEYGAIRADELRNDGDGSLATAWYGQRRELMDRGAIVSWPERHLPNEISALQNAMNLYFSNREAFFSEYQNAPLEPLLGDGQLDANAVAARVNNLDRGVVPLKCSHVTAFIDVQQRLLYWLVAAWGDDFTGAVLDYGSFPDQARRYFTSSDAQKSFAIPGAGIESQIQKALEACAGSLLGRTWTREDGTAFKIGRMLVDAGFQGDAVKEWARRSPHAALLMPSHGHGLTAASKPFSEYDRSRCEKLGTHWLIPKAQGKGRHCTIDTNWWKDMVAARLQQQVGDRGALSLFGRAGQDHKMLADHVCSEYWIQTEGRGRKLHEWRLRPGQTENHWWDCLVGSAVAASMQGAAIFEGVKESRPVATREEYEKRRREFEARRGF